MGLAIALCVAGLAAPAGASKKPPAVALVYGDSLVWESSWEISTMLTAKHVTDVNESESSTAPCDWLARLPGDLATYKPTTVTLATAGNSSAIVSKCMDDPTTGAPWPIGSAGYFAQYTSDLNAIFSAVTATGAKMVFVDDPPFAGLATDRNPVMVELIAIATQLAANYHGVSIVSTARTQLSKRGAYVAYKPCLRTETAAMGCVAGQIPIRTVAGDPVQIGLHLCPPSLTFPFPCSVYSSGEYRFGKVIADVAARPPKPVAA